jgi:[ribosomal protein S5]-alanine N-acetyltransferase
VVDARLEAAPAVELVTPNEGYENEFIRLVARSVDMHRGWVQPPSDTGGYSRYLERVSGPLHEGFFVVDSTSGDLVGVVNVNDIRLGSLRSASVGYYGFAGRSGGGRMTEGIRLAVDFAFDDLSLHRLEANIQPGNAPSISLVKRLGFRLEGFSPRYLYVSGDWRDHERWAVLSDEWA